MRLLIILFILLLAVPASAELQYMVALFEKTTKQVDTGRVDAELQPIYRTVITTFQDADEENDIERDFKANFTISGSYVQVTSNNFPVYSKEGTDYQVFCISKALLQDSGGPLTAWLNSNADAHKITKDPSGWLADQGYVAEGGGGE